jgi:hypothetical protein
MSSNIVTFSSDVFYVLENVGGEVSGNVADDVACDTWQVMWQIMWHVMWQMMWQVTCIIVTHYFMLTNVETIL